MNVKIPLALLLFAISSLVKAQELDAVYKWEPLLHYQYEITDNVHSASIILSKTYYTAGTKMRRSLRGSRGRKYYSFNRKIGLGATLIREVEWELIPHFHWRFEYKIAPLTFAIVDHKFLYDPAFQKFAWNPMFGFEVGFFGLNVGATISQNSPTLRAYNRINVGAFVVLGYHKMRVIDKNHGWFKKREESTPETPQFDDQDGDQNDKRNTDIKSE